MMAAESAPIARASHPVTLVAWAGMPVVIIAYLLLRYAIQEPFAQIASQFLYLIPLILATALTLGAAWIAPPRSRSKVVWATLAVAGAFMFVSELYFSWTLISHVPVTARGTTLDTLHAAAFLLLLATNAVMIGVDRLGLRRAARLGLELTALVTLIAVGLYHLSVWYFVDGMDRVQAMRMAVHALGGAVLFILSVHAYRGLPPTVRSSAWSRLLLLGICIYSMGLMLFPWWNYVLMGFATSLVLEVMTTALYLLGYYLVFLAALSRIVQADQSWPQLIARPHEQMSAWPAAVMSVGILLAVSMLGWVAFAARGDSVSQAIHMGALVVVTVCMVGRTAIATAESNAARQTMTLDVLTRAANPRGFWSRLAHDVSFARRFGDRVALIVVDVDDFRLVQEKEGATAADTALVAVAESIKNAAPESAGVYRMSSDEFAVIAQVVNREDARWIAERVLAAIVQLRAGEIRLSASVGFALAPDDCADKNELLRCADRALAWVKRSGKGRVAGFEDRIVSAIGSDERPPDPDSEMPDITIALVAAYDARDPENFEHARNVAALACLLADDLPAGRVDLDRLRVAAKLHDVGKIGLPRIDREPRSAHSPSALMMRTHCELGARMLESAGLRDLAQWVLHHHERWDGSGFPSGLAKKSIPLEARIIAIADSYEKLTSSRRPGGAMSRAAALQEIDQGIASRFDPALAERFIYVVGQTAGLGWSDEWPAA